MMLLRWSRVMSDLKPILSVAAADVAEAHPFCGWFCACAWCSNGGRTDAALQYFRRKGGSRTLQSYPYSGKENACQVGSAKQDRGMLTSLSSYTTAARQGSVSDTFTCRGFLRGLSVE